MSENFNTAAHTVADPNAILDLDLWVEDEEYDPYDDGISVPFNPRIFDGW